MTPPTNPPTLIGRRGDRVEWVRSGEGEELIPGMVVSLDRDEPVLCEQDDYEQFHEIYPDLPFTRELFNNTNSFVKVAVCGQLNISSYPENETDLMKNIRHRLIYIHNPFIPRIVRREYEIERLLERFSREYERVSSEQQRLMSEMNEVQRDYLETMQHAMQVRVSRGFVNCHEIKKAPIDRLYPHSCQNENCNRFLRFEELVMANGNDQMRKMFIEKTRAFLFDKYFDFGLQFIDHWCYIFGEHEYRQYLRKLYKNPDIKFFCCSCARRAEDNDWEMIVKEGKVYLERKKTDQHEPQFEGESPLQPIWDGLVAHVNVMRTLENERSRHEPFNPALEELTEQIRQVLYEGLGLTREQLFGSEDDD